MRRLVVVLPLALALTLALAGPALADAAPPLQPPGSSIAPEGATQVEMAAETVVVEVLPAHDWGSVHVQADFTMHNLGDAEEQLAVRFPMEDLSGVGDGYGGSPHVQDLTAAVNGAEVPTGTAEEPGEYDGSQPVTWAVFDVTFPPGEDVAITVNYTTELTGFHGAPFSGTASANYILETGAGWRGPIGSADIILRLPYEAGPQNVFMRDDTATGGEFAGNEVRWHYENLEPTRADNWHAYMVWPDDWQAILDLRQAVQGDPQDVDSWMALAKAYQGIGSEKHGMVYDEDLAALSESASQEAVNAGPQNAAAHAVLAEVLWWRSQDWDAMSQTMSADDPTAQAVLAEVATALELDPTNAQALALQDVLSQRLGITPAPKPTAAVASSATPEPPTATPVPSATPAPATATPAPTKAPDRAPAAGMPAWPLLATAAVAAVVVVSAVARKRR